MKPLFHLLSATLLFAATTISISCHTNEFPDIINSKLTAEHFRIKGTKLYAKNIEGFTYEQDPGGVFRNSDSVYIGCYYTPINFLTRLKDKDIEYYHNKNPEIIFTKQFKINGCVGIYTKIKENNKFWLYFIFGDSIAENRIVATLPISQPFEERIFDFVNNLYYEPTFKLDPFESAHFEIDTTNIGFHFVNYIMMQYTFIEDDYKKYETKNSHFNLISIAQQPPLQDSAAINKIASNMIQGLKSTSAIMSIGILERTTITIDSCFAIRILLEEKEGDIVESKNAIIYMVVTGNENGGVVFLGAMYHDAEKLIPLFDRMVNTLKIKKPV
jgi:hypothetical protein